MPRRKRPPAAAPRSAPAACAAAVEACLERVGVALTMGGEPTFVPLVPEGTEWSVDALGPTKLSYARRFAANLLPRVPVGALVLETSGKHYPGEPIPRWCLQIHWRTDGRPLWRDPSLLRTDDDSAPGPCVPADAHRLITAVAAALKLRARPVPLAEPTSAREGLHGGYALPLDHIDGRWATDRWPVPRKRLTLLIGDSWAGLRLPLSTLPERSLRRALVVEVRDGRLVVFIPPLFLPPYAELVGHIEDAVGGLGCGPVVLAGYLPPIDDQHGNFGLGADPGVIEANLPPSTHWEGYREWIRIASEAGSAVGLCMRKLHFNGRPTGTGGAAHICFGGPTADESPFLIRHDFLPSILRFWQRHPSLSYLFSGQYVGPSSQAPRVDESLPDALVQIELACEGVRELRPPGERFLFQQLFRDLLTDRGGNTHRAEISIDKLWNAGSPNGMLGIIEFRAFETHPDAEVLAVTGLFVRAVLAMLAARPFRVPFRSWGHALHDRFFLPTLLWRDVESVTKSLQRAGMPFDAEWLRPVWDFRFPVIGRLASAAGPVTFRQALEPWPMLSEQPHASATSRAVDSSLDRLEVSAPADAATQGALLVNGVRVPLKRSGDVALSGVRYRAFYLVAGLHPHIRAHAPLTLEWVHLETGEIEAAARFHPWHPRGEDYPGLPRDEREAASREAARWVALPASRGRKLVIPPLTKRAITGFTLDLRRCPESAPAT